MEIYNASLSLSVWNNEIYIFKSENSSRITRYFLLLVFRRRLLFFFFFVTDAFARFGDKFFVNSVTFFSLIEKERL